MIRRFNTFTALLVCLAALLVACTDGPDTAADRSVMGLLSTPAASGSMAPNLARGADGTLVLSWLEPEPDGHALRYAVLEQDAWGDARTVASGDNWFVNWADFPSVVPISDELWAAHWLVSREAGGYAYDVHAAFSNDSGGSWSEPFVPHTDGTDTEHGFVSIFRDPRGVGMVWLDGRKTANEYDEDDVATSGMTLRAAVFAADRTAVEETLVDDLICDCCQTDVAITGQGPVAVYRDRTSGEVRDIYMSRYADHRWQAGKPVADDGWEIAACPVNGPVIQASGSRLAVAWFSGSGGQPKVQLAWSDDAGSSLSPPIPVAAGGVLGHVGAALLPSGEVAITWLARTTDGAGAELHLQRFSRSGPAGPDRVVATGVASFGVPQIVRAGRYLLLAWTDASGDESAVKTALVSIQAANGNGP